MVNNGYGWMSGYIQGAGISAKNSDMGLSFVEVKLEERAYLLRSAEPVVNLRAVLRGEVSLPEVYARFQIAESIENTSVRVRAIKDVDLIRRVIRAAVDEERGMVG